MERRRLKIGLAGAAVTAVCALNVNSQEQPPSTTTVEACGPTIIPRNAEELLCEGRREGTLGVVVVRNLPQKDQLVPLDRKSVEELAKAATHDLDEESDGLIKLTPKVIYAPPQVGDAIKKSYKNGQTCIDVEDEDALLMGQVIKKFMPQTRQYAQVVTVGGDACGNIAATSSYGPTVNNIDLYNSDRKKMKNPFPGADSSTTFIGTLSHELNHHFALGHAGKLLHTDPESSALMDNASKDVDLNKVIRKSYWDEYGDLGNLMSKKPYPISKRGQYKPEDWINPMQKQYREKHSGESEKVFVQELSPSEQTTLTKGAEDSAQAVSFELEQPIALAEPPKSDKIGVGIQPTQEFTHVAMEPVSTDGKASVRVYLTGLSGSLLVTAKIGTFALPEDKPRNFYTESAKMSVQRGEDKAIVFSLTRP